MSCRNYWSETMDCRSGQVIWVWALLPCRWFPERTVQTPLVGWLLAPAGHLADTPRRGWGGQGPRCHSPCWAVEGFLQFPPHFSLNRDINTYSVWYFRTEFLFTLLTYFTAKLDLIKMGDNSTVMFPQYNFLTSASHLNGYRQYTHMAVVMHFFKDYSTLLHICLKGMEEKLQPLMCLSSCYSCNLWLCLLTQDT